ncbi:tetratricopeptide repeat protein [Kutzneria kofuensis]|uniref:tetratricopeptide repeat protein n=1 Tax=Kutzneria kofuensis TaxID=103725 RepID=UPI0031E6A514
MPFYVRALDDGTDCRPSSAAAAMLGLGSTYRTLGRYAEAVSVLSAGVAEFPDDRALAVFLAMALYNAGNAKEAVAGLLTVLADTSADPEVRRYERAIRLYAEDLDRVWD